ncbi:MAG: ABC transporter substrate-binding protein [Proteobacteria bacterium]|nr:ABC transporter substrate-binding protein [Pseudomonadota bacterium]NIS67947.1 ABC transporter substrate-binding protein [Pseudomonadota bacterium]
MKKGRIGLALIVFLVFPFSIHAGVPLETTQANVNKVLKVLGDASLQEEAKKEKIRSISNEMFDWNALSRLTLGRNWKKLNDAQRKEFMELYREILEGAYMGKLLDYTNEKVVFHKETMLSKNKAEVQTKIIAKNAEIPLHYRMIQRGGSWKVYDLIIEGVSLVKNYRSQFNEILRKKSPEELLKLLRKKGGKA